MAGSDCVDADQKVVGEMDTFAFGDRFAPGAVNPGSGTSYATEGLEPIMMTMEACLWVQTIPRPRLK
uniref:Uncharacterized protein n=1 Tax=Melanopsichium pennsylvanicum 4 TaxID=1398559 RepID=A0A077R378_9BASI|nr:uncharacterized protein BN887_06109 [Melanopsichium pennsylvanicum 4]